MIQERDFDLLARAWLERGPNEAPDRVIASVLEAAERTPQARRPIRWPDWRSARLTRASVGVGALAAFMMVVGGGIILGRWDPLGAGVPGVDETASPTSTPAPTPTPTPKPSTASTRALPMGTWTLGQQFDHPFTIVLPVGWRSQEEELLGNVTFGITAVGDRHETAMVTVHEIEHVYRDSLFADPCQTGAGPIVPPAPSSIDGVIMALKVMTGDTYGPISDVLVGGRHGKVIELTGATDIRAAQCGAHPRLPIRKISVGDPPAEGPNEGLREQIMVIDVDGTPTVIEATMLAGSPEATWNEIERVLKTLIFK